MASEAASRNEEFTFTHPGLGSLTGVTRSASVIQFRSIPYARIPTRFRQSVAIDVLQNHERKCIAFGASCPQVPQTLEPFGGPLPTECDMIFDEQECLNLTVTAPREALEAAQGASSLPVMVHVHGGGFSVGSHISSVREQSISDGTPVVIVSINYRVNWLGFLACQDLLDDARSIGASPFNFGLHDQRNALFWIQKHIGGFGGDKTNITAFGESAGSAALSLHLCSNTFPLFKRIVLQSGTPATAAPETNLAVKNEQYNRLLSYCGIDLNATDRLEQLRKAPVEKLVKAIGDLRMGLFTPFAEEGLFPIAPNYFNQVELFEKCSWITDAIIGDCSYEGYLFAEALKHIDLERFVLHFEEKLGKDNATWLLSAYGIERGLDKNLFWTRLNTLAGDLTFSQSTHSLTNSYALKQKKQQQLSSHKTIYRYSLELRNPFPGSIFYGVAGHHFIELLFQFQTLKERYPTDRLRAISTEFSQRLIKFAVGAAPWSPYEADEQRIAVVSSRDGWQVFTREEDMQQALLCEDGGRRYDAWEVMEEVWTALETRADKEDVMISSILYFFERENKHVVDFSHLASA
ncbi:Alpha/Beta hydrolase protein [Leptodontidium sp. 2 PMI_412]|nr:Alpha/Beta hydrolase protein [Leptodontidium sp. 2 PMI_412]